MAIKPDQLDELLTDCKTPDDVDKLYSQLLRGARGTFFANLLTSPP